MNADVEAGAQTCRDERRAVVHATYKACAVSQRACWLASAVETGSMASNLRGLGILFVSRRRGLNQGELRGDLVLLRDAGHCV